MGPLECPALLREGRGGDFVGIAAEHVRMHREGWARTHHGRSDRNGWPVERPQREEIGANPL